MNQSRRPGIIIVGAGPAGCACALMLAKKNIQVTIIEKSTFPRDKICGDALSPDVLNQLNLISPELSKKFYSIENKTPIHGGTIITSEGQILSIPIVNKHKQLQGFTCPRLVFDHFLFDAINNNQKINVIQNCQVNEVARTNKGITLKTSQGEFEADMIIGADGAQSVIARQVQPHKLDKKSYCAGLRVYYENVSGFHENNYIELFFMKEIMPGYLWVFPMQDGKANVGIGVLSSHVSNKKLNLKEVLTRFLETHPLLRDRFKNARPLETIKGFGLPLGSRKRSVSGERYLLTGDAASLIDPLSGEGIGNAIRSGRVAADHIAKCIEKNNYSAAFNKQYDAELYRKMWHELRISRRMQQILQYPRLLEYFVKKANTNKRLHQFLIDILEDMDLKKRLLHPRFYWELFFKK
ncbi:MAG: NAD(P)/FAD-dependent oxidoreductase [Saprospiraceae bacterium]